MNNSGVILPNDAFFKRPLTRALYHICDQDGNILGERKVYWCPFCKESGGYQSPCKRESCVAQEKNFVVSDHL